MEDPAVAAAVGAWRSLPPAAARVVLGLGVHPHTLIARSAVRAIAGGGQDGEAVVATLVAGGLLVPADEPAGGHEWWLPMPQAVRSVASEQALGLPPDEQATLLRTVCDAYWSLANHSDWLGTPYRTPPPYTPCVDAPSPFTTADQASTWLARASGVIADLAQSAYDHGLYETSWQLCDVLWPDLLLRGDRAQRLRIDELEVRAATAWGHAAALAESYKALITNGDWWTARRHIIASLELCKQAGNHIGVADAREALAALVLAQGNCPDALAEFTAVLELYTQLGIERKVALTLLNLGETCRRAGNLDSAARYVADALTLYSELAIPEPYNAALAVQASGRVHAARGDYDQAWTVLSEALRLLTAAGGHEEALATHQDLADVARARDWPDRELTQLRALRASQTAAGASADHDLDRRITDLTNRAGHTL